MASQASASPRINGTDLRFGNATIPLKTATAFWVMDKKTYRVGIDLRRGEYNTTLYLHLKNAENMYACISEFMKETKMTSYLFSIRAVKPILDRADRDRARASIEFKFSDKEERDFFFQYAAPLFPFPEFSMQTHLEEGTRIPCVQLCILNENIQEIYLDKEETQIARVNAVFRRIMPYFPGMNRILLGLNDPRFPRIPVSLDNGTDVKVDLDYHREFHVTQEEVVERLDFLPGWEVDIPVQDKDIEQWLENPALQPRQTEKYKGYLIELVKSVLQGQSVDNKKIMALFEACVGFNFNVGEIIKKALHL